LLADESIVEVERPAPLLVIISGPPGAGKTSIGRRLATDARLPFFTKDDFKDTLFDVLGIDDRAWSMKIGQAAAELLFKVVLLHLEAGHSLVVENAFIPKYRAQPFEELRRRFSFRTLQIWCWAKTTVLFERFASRARAGERHPGHVDHLSRPSSLRPSYRTGSIRRSRWRVR
jgi:predicted kinase